MTRKRLFRVKVKAENAFGEIVWAEGEMPGATAEEARRAALEWGRKSAPTRSLRAVEAFVEPKPVESWWGRLGALLGGGTP